MIFRRARKNFIRKIVTTLTVKQVIIRITVIISIVELVIMFSLALIPHTFGTSLEVFIDTVILVIVSTPIIYLWVIKPFVVARDEALVKLESMAYSDQLTGLPNRRFLTKYMEKIIAESVRHEFYSSLLLLDLDNFKPVNDNYGHNAGDAVLVEVANRLSANVREGDLVVRMGGDEFIVVLDRLGNDADLAGQEAFDVAEKLQLCLSQPIKFEGKQFQIGTSFGVRIFGIKKTKVETIVTEADTAMFQAKKYGKGHIVLFEL